MNLSFLVTALLFAASASAQPNRWFDAAPQLREFLQLTDSQLNAILEANRQFNEWSVEKQIRVSVVQREIAEETARSPLDPMALGVRYAEIETICRQARERSSELQNGNINLLTDAQKGKLKELEDALKLFPIISQAQSIRLLDAPGVMGTLTIANGFSRVDTTSLGIPGVLIPGCSYSPAVWIDTTTTGAAAVPRNKQ